MPYTLDNIPDAIKGLPKKAQEIFIAAYNSAFKQYEGDEEKSNATAWAAVKTKFEKKDDNWVAKESKAVRTPVSVDEISCPTCKGDKFNLEGNFYRCLTCNALLEAHKPQIESLRRIQADIVQEAGRRNASADSSRIKKIMELCQELLSSEKVEESRITEAINEANSVLTWLKEQALVKTEEAVKYPASAFAYVPDEQNPSTWKLRLWESTEKKVTQAQLNRAAAALSPGGFRGQKVEIVKEALPTVKRKIRNAYRSLDVADDDMPRWVQESSDRELLTGFIPLTEANISKGVAEITVIKPGFNASKERYYPSEVLARDYKVFEGVKMYADHPTDEDEKLRPERSIKDWVATLKNVHVNENGEIKGTATIVESWLREKLAALKDKGMLSEMGISINAVGTAVKGEINGIKTTILERIIRGRSVDFVTEAGAGGLVEMYESERELDVDFVSIDVLRERRPDLVKQIESAMKAEITLEAKKHVENEEKIKALESTVETLTTENGDLKNKITESEKAQKKAEAKLKIDEAVSKSELPEPSKARLLENFKDAETPDGINEAITKESDYVKSLNESKVKGMGPTTPDSKKIHEDLKESWKRMHPDWSEDQIAIAMGDK